MVADADPDRPAASPNGRDLPRVDAVEPAPAKGPCEACGSPHASTWATERGPARLCPACATLHGYGCP